MRETQLFPIASANFLARRHVYFVLKRVVDVLLSLVFLAIAAPLMLLIAFSIKLGSSGPVIFKQTRVGLAGRTFTFYKFRTMRQDADQELHRQYVKVFMRDQLPNTDNKPEPRSPLFKLTADPRVTNVGEILRRTSLDELPQLFNVIKGDMSLVGPRPALPYEVCDYQEWQKARLAALPGITGWWQVHGRSRVPFEEMVRMDVAYIAKQSLWLDFKLLILTIPAVILGKGAR